MSTPSIIGNQIHPSATTVTVNSNGQIAAVMIGNQGSGWQGLVGAIGVIGHQGAIGPQGIQGSAGFISYPSIQHWDIEHVMPHIQWKRFRYQKECWRLWHWFTYEEHDTQYHKTYRDFPSEQDAKNILVLEKLEEC